MRSAHIALHIKVANHNHHSNRLIYILFKSYVKCFFFRLFSSLTAVCYITVYRVSLQYSLRITTAAFFFFNTDILCLCGWLPLFLYFDSVCLCFSTSHSKRYYSTTEEVWVYFFTTLCLTSSREKPPNVNRGLIVVKLQHINILNSGVVANAYRESVKFLFYRLIIAFLF